MPQDKITVTILDDGTIKTETDKVSMPNHANAAGFLRRMFELAGGALTSASKKGRPQQATHGTTHSH
jgi:hypothetical protein